MNILVAFNLLEAAWWSAMAVLCGVKSRGRWKAVGQVATIFFLLFAVSDVIESRTGAWWNPPWLAILKGFCIVGLIGCGIWARQIAVAR